MKRPVRRLTALSLGLGMGAATLAVTAPALAETPALTYSCTAPAPVNKQDSTIRYDTDLPEKLYVGESGPLEVGVSSSGVAAWSAVKLGWDLMSVRKIGGDSQMPMTIGGESRTVAMNNPVVDIVNGQDTRLIGSGVWGTWTPPATPQVVEVKIAASYKTQLKLLKSNGSPALDAGDSTCTLKSPAAGLVADTVKVMARSTTTLTAASLDVVEDSPVEVSAEVTVTGGAAAGDVRFQAGDKKVTTKVVGGRAAAEITGLAAGTYPLTATFVPTQAALYEPSTSAEQQLNVTPPVPATTTTTTVALEQATVSSDQQARAVVQVSSEEGVPSGSARVMVNGKPVVEPLVDGRATLTLPRLKAGTYPVVASYVPTNAREYASSQASTQLTVLPGAGGEVQSTSTWLELPRTTLVFGRTMAVTARVTAEDAPVGRVEFTVAGRTLSAPVLDGRATVSLPYLPLGEYPVTAEFLPGSGEGFEPSTAEPLTFHVVRSGAAPGSGLALATTTELTTSTRATAGVATAVRAVVEAEDGDAGAGEVVFRAGTSSVRLPLTDGVAAGRVTFAGSGRQVVTAVFVPSDDTAQEASLGRTWVSVAKSASTTTVRAKATKKKVVATIAVRGAGSRCGGKVTLVVSRGAKKVRTVRTTVSCTGTAKVTLTKLRKGRYTLRASYAGTGTSAASVGTVKVAKKK